MAYKVPAEVLILIVDDNEDSAWSLGVYLESCGFRTTLAPNGLLALRSAREHRPDLILLDLEMPEMGGVAFRKAQLQSQGLADIPVVCISGLVDAHERAREAGLTSVFLKPVPLVPLLSEVQRLVGVEPAVNPAPSDTGWAVQAAIS